MGRSPYPSDLEGVFATFAGADADRFLQVRDENLPVTDLARLSRLQNCIDDGLEVIVGANNFDFDFGNKIDRVFGATVNLGVPFLTTETPHFAYRHAMDAMFGQGVLHVF